MNKNFPPPSWVHSTNVYEVNIRQYTEEGTFNAFAAALPRLKAMGIETLWLMPVTPIAQKNKKGSLGSPYACSDYISVNPEFGTMQDLEQLIRVAHEMGFKIIIDWVANHTGWDHVWTVEHPDYYLKDSNTNDFKMASGMEDIIELNYTNPGLRKAMIQAMQFWVKELDIDGFRCDLASWVQLDFWQEARPALDKIKSLFWLGEFDELENPEYKTVFDCSYSWQWMHKTGEFYKGSRDRELLESLLIRYDTTVHNSMNLWFTSNHDENSWNGSEYEKYGAMAAALAVFSVCWNGVPLIYSGQEMPNLKRLEFFDKDPIEWSGEYQLHDFYQRLLSLKKNNPALRAGDEAVTTYRLQTQGAGTVLAWLRKNGPHEVITLLNLSDEPVMFTISMQLLAGEYRNIFDGDKRSLEGGVLFEMGAWGYLVFEK